MCSPRGQIFRTLPGDVESALQCSGRRHPEVRTRGLCVWGALASFRRAAGFSPTRFADCSRDLSPRPPGSSRRAEPPGWPGMAHPSRCSQGRIGITVTFLKGRFHATCPCASVFLCVRESKKGRKTRNSHFADRPLKGPPWPWLPRGPPPRPQAAPPSWDCPFPRLW